MFIAVNVPAVDIEDKTPIKIVHIVKEATIQTGIIYIITIMIVTIPLINKLPQFAHIGIL